MKKIISVLMLTSILTGLTVSCGDTEVGGGLSDSISVTDETTVPETDGLPDKDMEGWKLSILNYDLAGLSWANTRITYEEQSGDILEDAIYKRNRELEDRYNFSFAVGEVAETIPVMKTNVTAGDEAYDIYVVKEGAVEYVSFASDWNNIPHLQLDKAWWNPAATSIYNVDGIQTALAGNTSLSVISRAVCMVFNKNIWAKYGDSSINFYDLVKDNKWTFDKYLESISLVSADLNGDTKMDENDLYGLYMGRGFKGYIASFLTGCGMNFTENGEDGKPSFTLNVNERGIDLVTRLVDALGNEGYYYNTCKDAHSAEPSNFFPGGHALFTQGVPHDIYKLRDMNDDIGMIPMPKYDENQDKYYSAAWGGTVWTLSKTFNLEYADNMGIVLEALSYMTYNDVIPVYKEVALKTKTTRDNESADMLDIIFNSIYFDFGTNVMYDAVFADTFLTAIWKAKSSDVIMSSIVSALPKINDYIERFNKFALEME